MNDQLAYTILQGQLIPAAQRAIDNPSFQESFIKEYGFTIPSEGALLSLKELINNRMLISLSSGSTIWEALLLTLGVKVITNSEDRIIDNPVAPIVNMKCKEALIKYSRCKVLLLNTPTLSALNAVTEFKGDMIIYIGENNIHFNGFQGDVKILIPTLSGRKDRIITYIRK